MRPWVYRAECGACGLRRAWTVADRIVGGRVVASIAPNSPGGPLDDPCPSCGTDDPRQVRRCWSGPHAARHERNDGTGGARWRYHGVGQHRLGWRVPLPDGPWPRPVRVADVEGYPPRQMSLLGMAGA